MQATTQTSAAEAAKSKVESIEQAILSGDKKLTANNLAAARNDLEFAELQDAAQRLAEEKAANEKRKANLLKLQETLRQLADSRPEIDKKYVAFEKTLTDYLSAVFAYQQQLTGIRQQLGNGGFLVGQLPGPLEGISASDGRTLEIGDISAETLEPQSKIRELVDRQIGEHLGGRIR